MGTTSTLVLKDSANKTIKGLGSKATLTELSELNKKNPEGVIVIEEEKPKDDPLKPVNIKMVQLTGVGKTVAANGAASLSGVIISLDMPSAWDASIKYQVRFFDRKTKELEKEANLTNIKIEDDGTNAEFGLTGRDTKLAHYYYEKEMSISADTYKSAKLVQVRRKKEDDTWSEWGTELHNDYTVGGKITIFKRELELSYKTGDENIGLKPGQEIVLSYDELTSESFAKNFPKRIFEDKVETSLLGLSIKVSKLNYNTRTKNFQLAIKVDTGDIPVDVTDAAAVLKYYKRTAELPTASAVPAGYAESLTNLKKNGIELLPGFTIKEVSFELNTNDELPGKKSAE
jgi:hypothetical protein